MRSVTTTSQAPQEAEDEAPTPIADRLVEKPTVPALKGKVGYFKLRPSFWKFPGEASKVGDPDDTFEICDKFKVERVVVYTPPFGGGGQFLFELSQGKRRYFVDTVGDYDATDDAAENMSALKNLKRWFSASSVVGSGTVKLSGVTKNRHTAVCVDKSVFTGMSQSEFRLVMEEPQSINRTVTGRGKREQWVYGNQYYYFDNGSLTAWQD